MQWRGRRQSDNIEDRRGGGRKAGGIGIGSVVIALILWKVFGIDPQANPRPTRSQSFCSNYFGRYRRRLDTNF